MLSGGIYLIGKRKCDGFVVGLISVSVAPERKQNNEWSCEVVVGAPGFGNPPAPPPPSVAEVLRRERASLAGI